MKKLEKIEIIDLIGRELQERMKFVEIDGYFQSYGIPTDHQPSYNSKYVYVKEVLPKIKDEIILEIASELGIDHPAISSVPVIKESDATFWKPGHFKLFISHLASFKKTIGILKNELEKYGISSFVAHEDIEPTKQWQDEIEKGLFSMDALCAVLMPGFKESNWTDQEIGVAIGRNVLIIPIRRELDPYGFIGKFQGFQAVGKNVGQVAEGIFEIISSNPKTKTKYLNTLVELILLSNTVNQGIERLEAFVRIKDLPLEKVEYLQERIIENENLKNTRFLKPFNQIALKYNLERLSLKDFEKKKDEDYDELPF
ncbi:toll/interleukin-1 receptor domain-containing protein [Robertkochia solimangrovi]|uniref:toll/interleukin-1 receptor domain-containing protein n=1 Tax=Robertkochia solimangrovi TaxID=2213046 RepID=UPI00117E205F|nr:toll/interleukin-1 receptor domain-containing protein [Robertkochia solimangrovi]TRZ45128.1 toll/interleukin-1 receptor domain-containing protein [Robertkochia solimangrovi]